MIKQLQFLVLDEMLQACFRPALSITVALASLDTNLKTKYSEK